VHPDERGAQDCPEHLCCKVGSEFGKITLTHREADGHRRIQMCIAAPAGDGREDARHHCERPPGGDHHPSAALGFGMFEQHRGDNSIA
jgi:hypothetical protein